MHDAARSESTRLFSDLGEQAAARIGRIHFLRALKISALPVFGGAVVVWTGLRLAGVSPGLLMIAAVSLVAVWLAGSAAWAVARRPRAFAALARWDEAAGRREAFASAAFFEAKSGQLDEGERLHIQRCREQLDDGPGALARDLPLPSLRWQWAAPFVFLALAFLPWPQLFGVGDDAVILTDAMEAAARAEAEELARRDQDFEKMESLSEEERERAEKLRDALRQTAEDLAESEGRDAREVLDELEARAREAEKLARDLGADEGAWASDAMLEEMARHADTADLAAAIRDKDAGQSADESEKVAETLDDESLTADAEDRIEQALERTMEKATGEDREKPVGGHVESASEEMTRENPAGAANEFEELAKHFRRIEQRQNAQKELERLAQQLRGAGSSIAGQNADEMEKLASSPAGDEGAQPAEAGQGPPADVGQTPMNTGNMPQLSAPGFESPDFNPSRVMQGSPVPGTMDPSQLENLTLVPGELEDPDKLMLLPAPIPGTEPGDSAILIPGAGQQGNLPIAGLLPGSGVAGLGENQTDATPPKFQGAVAPQLNAAGESAVRSIQGGVRSEDASRSRQDIAVEFLKVQEEALDEQAVPLSRRTHVRRYFNSIRERFEP